MNVINANSQTVLGIGRQGEYGVSQVIFDLNGLIEEFGDGTAVLVHQPYSSSAYIVPPVLGETYDGAVQDGDVLIWHIGQLATNYVGNGGAELRWYVEGKLKKSKIYDTQCIKALGETTVITDLQQSYIDQMAEIASAYVNIDSVPTQGSTNAVTSGGVYDAIQSSGGGGGGGSVTVDSSLSGSSENPVQNKVIYNALAGKANASDIPSKTSDLTNDSGFLTSAPVSSVNGQTGAVVISNATTSSAGLMSATDKSNLDTLMSDYQSASTALG